MQISLTKFSITLKISFYCILYYLLSFFSELIHIFILFQMMYKLGSESNICQSIKACPVDIVAISSMQFPKVQLEGDMYTIREPRPTTVTRVLRHAAADRIVSPPSAHGGYNPL